MHAFGNPPDDRSAHYAAIRGGAEFAMSTGGPLNAGIAQGAGRARSNLATRPKCNPTLFLNQLV